MKLFSEKVDSTFTNSSFNVLQVESFSEIFFDVYEIELNKIKYPAEKIGDYNSHPVVSVPVVIGEQECDYPFVLIKGPFEILFNENNKVAGTLSRRVNTVDTTEPEVVKLFEQTSEEDELTFDNLIEEESREKIVDQIKIAKRKAAVHIAKLKQAAIEDATIDLKLKKEEFDKVLQVAKDQLVSEFVYVSNNIKQELLDGNDSRYFELESIVSEKINKIASSLHDVVVEDFNNATEAFDISIKTLISNIHDTQVLPRVESILNNISSTVDDKVTKLSELVEHKLASKADTSLLEDISNSVNAVQVANVELNNAIVKGVNKALSRVGTVNTKINEAVVALSDNVETKIKNATDSIVSYYTEKIQKLEDRTFEINESSRQYFINLVQESRDNLIKEIRDIKQETPVEYIVESKNGRATKSLDSITSELDKKITGKVSEEIARLKQYISMYSSGGGSVAKQFAAGGTMAGNLTVTGSISASNYLGLVIPNPDLTKYLPISGGTITGDLTVKNTLSAYSLSADRIFVSQLDALSANITVIDIKQYELSGFNVTGDCTIQGSVSSNNAIYGTNLVYTSTLTALSSNWNSTFNTVSSLSSNWNSTFNTVSSLSSNWQTAYTTLSTKANLTGDNLFSGTQTVSGILSSNNAVYGNNLVYLNGNTTGSNVTIGTNDSYNLALKTNNVTKMTIMSSGNVGIGTNSPSQLLHVNGDGARIRISSTNSFNNPVLELAGTSYVNFLFAGSDGAWNVRTDSAARPVYIQSIGNQTGSLQQGTVQIGGISAVSAPTSQLVVRSNFNNLTGNLLELQGFVGNQVARITNTGDLSTSGTVTATNLVYNTTDQTIAGIKSFTTPIAISSGGTGLSSLGTGISAFLATPSSANLLAAVTDETGTGALVFGTSPTLSGTLTVAQASNAIAAKFTAPNTASDLVNLQSTSATGYSSIGFYDENNVAKGSFGYSNNGGGAIGDKVFFSAVSTPMVFSTNQGTTSHISIATSGGVSIGTTTDAGATNLLVAGSATSTTVAVSGTNTYSFTNGNSLQGTANCLLLKSGSSTLYSMDSNGGSFFGGSFPFMGINDRTGGAAYYLGFYGVVNTGNLFSGFLNRNTFSIGTTNGRITLGLSNYNTDGNARSSKVTIIGEGTTTTPTLDVQDSTGTSSFKVLDNGDVSIRKTITAAGTTGAQTINKPSGSVNFAAGATSLVVTNSLCTTSSVILVSIATNDTTATGIRVVAAAGSFTIYMLTAPTSECRVNFLLTN